VIFKEQSTNQMRNRLQVFPEIDTDGKCIWVLIKLFGSCVNASASVVLFGSLLTCSHLCRIFSCVDAGWWHPGQCPGHQFCFFCLEGNSCRIVQT
jgi:hypothetical protein